MGDLQEPTDGSTELYHMLGHLLWIYSLKFREDLGLKFEVGTSNQSDPEDLPLMDTQWPWGYRTT